MPFQFAYGPCSTLTECLSIHMQAPWDETPAVIFCLCIRAAMLGDECADYVQAAWRTGQWHSWQRGSTQ